MRSWTDNRRVSYLPWREIPIVVSFRSEMDLKGEAFPVTTALEGVNSQGLRNALARTNSTVK